MLKRIMTWLVWYVEVMREVEWRTRAPVEARMDKNGHVS